MYFCDLTLPSAEENLACDEILLESAEYSCNEVLRFWEPDDYFVVLGYGNRAALEVNLPVCEENNIPVFRRLTGGGTVLQGPGCLNYSLILRSSGREFLQTISATNAYILERHRQALANLLQAPLQISGITDLAINNLKFAGNAQRRKKDFLIFHGSFLLQMDISLVEKALRMPTKQPPYRLNRSHSDFLVNLKIPADEIKAALKESWEVSGMAPRIPLDEIGVLARSKYLDPKWNFRI
jgi:lipoate-protein ligase A